MKTKTTQKLIRRPITLSFTEMCEFNIQQSVHSIFKFPVILHWYFSYFIAKWSQACPHYFFWRFLLENISYRKCTWLIVARTMRIVSSELEKLACGFRQKSEELQMNGWLRVESDIIHHFQMKNLHCVQGYRKSPPHWSFSIE